MRKIILLFITFSIIFFHSESYADTYKIKVPIDFSEMWLSCEKDWDYYKCTIEPWFWSIQKSIWKIIQYLTFIAWLAWVLYIIFNWIMLSMAWLDQEKEKSAKDHVKKALLWLVLLLLSWALLNFIAPWVYK